MVTNLAPNHLDVHRDMAEYVEAKKHVFSYQGAGDVLVLNGDNAITRSFAAEAPGQVRWFPGRAARIGASIWRTASYTGPLRLGPRRSWRRRIFCCLAGTTWKTI